MKDTIQKQIERFESKFMDRGNYVYQVEIKDFLKTSLESVWEEAVKETTEDIKKGLTEGLKDDYMIEITAHNLKALIDNLKQTT